MNCQLLADIEISRNDIANCNRPSPCESCDILNRLLNTIENQDRALRKAYLQLERISNFSPFDPQINPGCGSSEYSISGYKSFIAQTALAEIETVLK